MGEIRPLTGFRFLAAFYVFIFHVNMPFRAPLLWLPVPLTGLINQGRLGVTAFFLLSGFVLVYSHINEFKPGETKSIAFWGAFMFKRLARIYPVFFAGLLATFICSYFIHTLPRPFIVLFSAAFVQTYFPSIAMQWYDGGAWSVANEIFFYLLFPLALPLLLRVSSLWLLLLVLAASAGACSLAGLWSWVGPNFGLNTWQLSFSFPPARFPEFLAGMATALLVLRFRWQIRPGFAVGAGAVTLAYLAWLAPRMGGSAVLHDWLVVPSLALIFSSITFAPRHPLFRWLGSNGLRYLGLISYAFYIAQIPLSSILDWLISSHRVRPENPLIWPLSLMFNLIMAVFMHHIIEKPAHRILIAWSRQKQIS